MFYNYRNSKGQFARPAIVPGRLYDFRGITVRAKQLKPNGMRLVAAHKVLTGLVKDSDLRPINRRRVNSYLATAN